VFSDEFIWTRVKGGKAKKRKIIKITGSQNLEELKRRMNLWHIAKTKAEVMSELPELIREERVIDLTGAQDKAYTAVVEESLQTIMKDEHFDRKKAYNCLQKLLKLCDTFKYEDVKDIIRDMSQGTKAVIFTWFVDTANAITCALQAEGYTPVCITGETPIKEREKSIKLFQEDQGYTILVATIATCSVGLDFSMASECVFLSRSYTPAINEQSVTEIVLYCSDTVEERVHEILEMKKDLINELFSKEQFLGLFKKKSS
jgi:SNF2 family DNA or RNA helicase